MHKPIFIHASLTILNIYYRLKLYQEANITLCASLLCTVDHYLFKKEKIYMLTILKLLFSSEKKKSKLSMESTLLP